MKEFTVGQAVEIAPWFFVNASFVDPHGIIIEIDQGRYLVWQNCDGRENWYSPGDIHEIVQP